MHQSLLFVPFCLCAALAAAQAPLHFTPVLHQYTTAQGLPSNEVFAIEQDRQGYMWFGTNNGVCRFNGYTFERFPDTLQSNYTSVLSMNMMEDSCGRMWWADFQGRVFYHENGRIIPWAHNDTLAKLKGKFDFIESLVVEGCGEQVWMNLRFFGIFHARADGSWEMMPTPGHTTLLYHEIKGRHMEVHIPEGNRRHLTVYFQPYQVQSPNLYEGSEGGNGEFLAVLPIGKERHLVAFVSPDPNLFLFHRGILQKKIAYDLKATCAHNGPDGSLLLAHINGGGVRRYRSLAELEAGKPELTFLEGLSVNKIVRDREGGYWFSTQEQGVFYSPGLETAVVRGLPGIEEEAVIGVVAARDGILYAGTRSGRVFELDIRRMRGRDISPGNVYYLNTLYYDPETQLMIAAGTPSAFFRQGRWFSDVFQLHLQIRAPLGGYRYVKVVGRDMWWSVSPSLFLLDIGKRRQIYDYQHDNDHALEHRRPIHRFFSIGLSADGVVYAGTRSGLWAINNDSLVRPEPMHPSFLHLVEDIVLMPDSSLALAIRGYGVAFWKPGSGAPPRIIGYEQGLAFNRIPRLYLEPGGALWACTELGAGRISPDRHSIENYTVQTGLPSNHVHQVAFSGGYYWFATAAGLARIQSRMAPAQMTPPIIEFLTVNGKRYPPNGVELPHDSTNISVEWTALHYRSMGRISYRYRLRSGSRNEVWAQSMQRSVNFSGLLPGEYTFEVQAQNEGGEWSKSSSLYFVIRPPWWQRGWFRLSLLLLAGGLVFGFYKYRTGQLKRAFALKQQIFELERSALQAQMNPHFIFNCLNSIQNFIAANDKDRAATFLAQFARLIRQTLEHSFQKEITLEDEVAYLNNYLSLEHLRFRDAFHYEIVVNESLDTYETVLPSMLVQPFVENAIVHGMRGRKSEGRVEVRFEPIGEKGLQISVEDNGPEHKSAPTNESREGTKRTSYGVQLARRRLELAMQYPHSTIQTTAREGGGTRVEIVLK